MDVVVRWLGLAEGFPVLVGDLDDRLGGSAEANVMHGGKALRLERLSELLEDFRVPDHETYRPTLGDLWAVAPAHGDQYL